MDTISKLSENNNFYKFISTLFSVFVLCWPIIIFGRPYIYPDTNGYLSNVYNLEYISPYRNTIGYAIFIKYICFPKFLFTVAFIQTYILVVLIKLLMKNIFKDISEKSLFFAFLCLGLFTVFDQITATLMPDVFCSILLFSFYLLSRESNKFKQINYGLIFSFSMITHSIYPIIAFFLVFVSLVKKRLTKICFLFFITGFIFVPLWYFHLSGKTSPHGNGAKVIALLVEHGLVKKYLNQHCSLNYHYLCDLKEQLPETAHNFAWNEKWLKESEILKKGNLNPIIFGIFKNYPSQTILAILKSTWSQIFVRINVLTFNPINIETIDIKEYIKYKTEFALPPYIEKIFLIFMMFFLFYRYRNMTEELRWFITLLLVAYFSNAILNAVISYPTTRYSLRLIWILPFFFFLEIAKAYEKFDLRRQELTN